MNASPELLEELARARPRVRPELRARVREIAAAAPRGRPRPSLDPRRVALVVAPAVLALAVLSAGVVGLSRSGERQAELQAGRTEAQTRELAPTVPSGSDARGSGSAAGARAQRVTATLTLEATDSGAVARGAQKALDVTRALGGHVVSSSVTTGRGAQATMVVRVPVESVQSALTQLSALGRIVSQQVDVADLQETLDDLRARNANVRAQLARIAARLEAPSLAPELRAALLARRQVLRDELGALRRGLSTTSAEARTATMQLTLATPEVLGTATAPSRFDRTLDEAVNVLAWEAVLGLALAIVLAPLALVVVLTWLGRRAYRRHEDERLLAA